MANWNTPNNSEPSHENVLKALADKDTYSLTMGQAGGIWTNQPVGAMLWNNSAAYFQRWDGSNAIPVVISVAGGGTGASTAVQARANLGANDAGNLTTGTLPTGRLSGTYSINISGNAATATNATNATNAADSALLQGNNAAFYRNASNLNAGTVPAALLASASTSTAGIVQLNNTLTSTSTTEAATANALGSVYAMVSGTSFDLWNQQRWSATVPDTGGTEIFALRNGITVTVYFRFGGSLPASTTAVALPTLPEGFRPYNRVKDIKVTLDTRPNVFNVPAEGQMLTINNTGTASISFIDLDTKGNLSRDRIDLTHLVTYTM